MLEFLEQFLGKERGMFTGWDLHNVQIYPGGDPDLFFAELTLTHGSSSDPGRVILNGESHISNGLVSGGQVRPFHRERGKAASV